MFYLSYSTHLCGNWTQDTKQRRKTKRKRQKPTCHGEQEASQRRAQVREHKNHSPSTRNSEWKAGTSQRAPEATRHQLATTSGRRQILPWQTIYSWGELRRPKLLKVDVAETHWWRNLNSPWRMHVLARRVQSEHELNKSPFSHFGIESSYLIERDRANFTILHRVRVIEGGFFHMCWEITSL